MDTATSMSNEKTTCDLGSLEDTPIAKVPSGDANLPSTDLQTAESDDEEHHEATKTNVQDMNVLILPEREDGISRIPGTQGDGKHSSKFNEPCGVQDMKIVQNRH
jgi:hypothetical protein